MPYLKLGADLVFFYSLWYSSQNNTKTNDYNLKKPIWRDVKIKKVFVSYHDQKSLYLCCPFHECEIHGDRKSNGISIIFYYLFFLDLLSIVRLSAAIAAHFAGLSRHTNVSSSHTLRVFFFFIGDLCVFFFCFDCVYDRFFTSFWNSRNTLFLLFNLIHTTF